MANLDLHALANTPGAGRAFAELEAAGLIREDPDAPLWRVTLDGQIPVTAEVSVRAHSRDEANRIAERRADSEGLWQTDGPAEAIATTAYRVQEDQ